MFYCSSERHVTVCEGRKQTIKCEHQEIDIISANYGRHDRDVCQSGLDFMGAWAWDVNCGDAAHSLNVVTGECQGLSECDLHANNAEFGDPCLFTKKYLKVNRLALFLRNYFVLTSFNSSDILFIFQPCLVICFPFKRKLNIVDMSSLIKLLSMH